jgi:hypothetical protein
MEPRPRSLLRPGRVLRLFVLFLYGPTITIGILSFQGPQGGLTFPMRGVSLHWFRDLFEQQAVGDIWGSVPRARWRWADGHGHHRRGLGDGRAGLPQALSRVGRCCST